MNEALMALSVFLAASTGTHTPHTPEPSIYQSTLSQRLRQTESENAAQDLRWQIEGLNNNLHNESFQLQEALRYRR